MTDTQYLLHHSITLFDMLYNNETANVPVHYYTSILVITKNKVCRQIQNVLHNVLVCYMYYPDRMCLVYTYYAGNYDG